jgi:alkanesulfonate monooxygenase SsuD/methylene tetrahydromethanopterin reductase-like flavin-dependent oxidoreductase (luciferase family)
VAGRPRENGIARPRILVGGEGTPRGFRIAARWADEFNLSSSSPEQAVDRFAALDGVVRAAGRDPATLAKSAMVGVLVGANADELTRRAEAITAGFGIAAGEASEWLKARSARWIVGTPDEARAMVRRYADAGAERLMLQDFLPMDLEMVDLLGRELIGQV